MGLFDFLKKKAAKKSLPKNLVQQLGILENQLRDSKNSKEGLEILNQYEKRINELEKGYDVSVPKEIAKNYRQIYKEKA